MRGGPAGSLTPAPAVTQSSWEKRVPADHSSEGCVHPGGWGCDLAWPQSPGSFADGAYHPGRWEWRGQAVVVPTPVSTGSPVW